MRTVFFEAREADEGLTAFAFLKRKGLSYRAIMSFKKYNGLTRGNEVLRVCDKIRKGDVIKAEFREEGKRLEPNFDVKAKIVAENEDFVVFEKPAGVAVHPSAYHYSDTLGNLFSALYPEFAFRPVYRLDNNTSGLVLCAKNAASAPMLAKSAEKVYFAVVYGNIEEEGRITLPIGRAEGSVIKREVREDGDRCETLYKPILQKNGKTLLQVRLKTGRTHQIRVHFAYLGYPLCGDELYGGNCEEIARHALHCGELRFTRPFTGETEEFKSPLPEDMERLIRN